MTVEYCLFGIQSACLPSSDWAAWVQAMGAIGALYVAIRLAKSQAQSKKTDARLGFHFFVLKMVEGIETFHYEIGRSRDLGRLREVASSCNELFSYGRSIDLSLLEPQSFSSALELRSICAEILVSMGEYAEHRTPRAQVRIELLYEKFIKVSKLFLETCDMGISFRLSAAIGRFWWKWVLRKPFIVERKDLRPDDDSGHA